MRHFNSVKKKIKNGIMNMAGIMTSMDDMVVGMERNMDDMMIMVLMIRMDMMIMDITSGDIL